MLKIIKALVYLFLFLKLGQAYGFFEDGIHLENSISLLVTVFFIFYFVELFFSLVKKKIEGPIEEENKVERKKIDNDKELTFEEVFKEALKEFEKTWNIVYKNQTIKIINKYNYEQLYINGQLVDEKRRKGILSYFIPFQKLSGVIEVNGEKYIVKVFIGGFVTLNCKVYVNKKLILKDKVKMKFDD